MPKSRQKNSGNSEKLDQKWPLDLFTHILAHELGHLTGYQDDGPGNLNNVKQWENPVMEPIDGLIRTE